MTLREMRCREAANRVAVSLLLFLLLYLAMGAILSVVPYFTQGLSQVAADVMDEVIHGILYAAAFLLPALMLVLAIDAEKCSRN